MPHTSDGLVAVRHTLCACYVANCMYLSTLIGWFRKYDIYHALPDLFSVFVYAPMMERAGEMILRFSAILLFLVNSARPQGKYGSVKSISIDCPRAESFCGSDDSFDELSDVGEPRS